MANKKIFVGLLVFLKGVEFYQKNLWLTTVNNNKNINVNLIAGTDKII